MLKDHIALAQSCEELFIELAPGLRALLSWAGTHSFYIFSSKMGDQASWPLVINVLLEGTRRDLVRSGKTEPLRHGDRMLT